MSKRGKVARTPVEEIAAVKVSLSPVGQDGRPTLMEFAGENVSLNKRNLTIAALVVGIGLILVVIGYLLPLREWIERLNEWTSGRGVIGVLVFAASFVGAVVVLLPSSVFTMVAGLTYGLFWGTLLSAASATVGAMIAFLVARYLAHEQVQRWVARHPRVAALNDVVSEHQWKIVFLLRLAPMVPFGPINYSLGLSKIRFVPYVTATASGLLPGTFLYTYAGYAGTLLFLEEDSATTFQYVMLAAGLLLVIGLVVYLSRQARKALDDYRERTT